MVSSAFLSGLDVQQVRYSPSSEAWLEPSDHGQQGPSAPHNRPLGLQHPASCVDHSEAVNRGLSVALRPFGASGGRPCGSSRSLRPLVGKRSVCNARSGPPVDRQSSRVAHGVDPTTRASECSWTRHSAFPANLHFPVLSVHTEPLAHRRTGPASRDSSHPHATHDPRPLIPDLGPTLPFLYPLKGIAVCKSVRYVARSGDLGCEPWTCWCST